MRVLLEIVHAKVTPVLILEDKEILVGFPEQMVCEAGVGVTVGLGFTVIVNVIGVPSQIGVEASGLVNFGVTVIVEIRGAVPVFVAVKTGIDPVPDAPSPIDVFEFDQ